MKIRLYLKSGNSIVIEVSEYSMRKAPGSAGLIQFSWEYASDAPTKLKYVNLDQIEAIVEVD